jgi:hypothetical protein
MAKGKVIDVHATKAYRQITGIAALILDLST